MHGLSGSYPHLCVCVSMQWLMGHVFYLRTLRGPFREPREPGELPGVSLRASACLNATFRWRSNRPGLGAHLERRFVEKRRLRVAFLWTLSGFARFVCFVPV